MHLAVFQDLKLSITVEKVVCYRNWKNKTIRKKRWTGILSVSENSQNLEMEEPYQIITLLLLEKSLAKFFVIY